MSLSLSVQSLLLVDALQTLGHDYELLVASHRLVSVDSVSGSLRGGAASEPASPPPSVVGGSPPSHLDLSLALSSLSETGGRRAFVSPAPDNQQQRLEFNYNETTPVPYLKATRVANSVHFRSDLDPELQI